MSVGVIVKDLGARTIKRNNAMVATIVAVGCISVIIPNKVGNGETNGSKADIKTIFAKVDKNLEERLELISVITLNRLSL
jgi:hypothetical protein